MPKANSRLPGFYKAKMAERLRRLAEALELDRAELHGLGESGSLPAPLVLESERTVGL